MTSLPRLVGRLGRDAETLTVVSINEKFQRKAVFLDLPIDIFLKLLDWLEIPDVFNLRSVCRALNGLTRLHSIWAKFTACHVIGRNLPWPSWALPLSDVPSPTLEHLTLRALRMRTLWDAGDPKTHRKLSRFIQRPRESITWLRLIHSRWLVVQQNAAILEFWDLEDVRYEKPTLIVDSLDGIVDGSVVWSRGKSTGTMVISTSSRVTGRIEFSLPFPEEGDVPSDAKIVESFADFSRLMDADEHLAAFLHYKGRNGNFVRNTTGSVVRLDPSLEYSEQDSHLKQAYGIQIKRKVVAVATSWGVDLYCRETIATSLQHAASQGNEVSILPLQRIPYSIKRDSEILEEVTTASAFFLAQNPKFVSPPSDEDTIFLCVRGVTRGQHLYEVQPVKDLHKGPSTYKLLPKAGLFWPTDDMLFCAAGESGRRFSFVVDELPRGGLSLCGISIPTDLSQHDKASASRGRIGWWHIADKNSKDLVHHVVFEEATGACAIAMGSGRVWIADLTASEIISQSSADYKDGVAEATTPRPDLAWPHIHPFPWPAVVDDHDDSPGLNDTSINDWDTNVETYYPSINRPDCFGGATWFVNQALNIPGPATSLFSNVPAGGLWAVEIISVRDRLLGVNKS
ncbi:hypothetical protein FRC04_000713 [Tulasnella sp. 424]|nr:hypothetical protein FRC04_000713 [Tulasnella sp. 424]